MFRILILVFALASGGFAAWLALGSAEQSAAEPVAVTEPKEPAQEVLVASTDIGHGAVLEESQLRWQPWTGGEVPAVFISRSSRPQAPQTLKGSHVRGGFVAGEPVREDKLAQSGAGLLSGQLPSGKRAIAVRVTAESTAGGFVMPNDRVDLVHTKVRPGQSGDEGQVVSRTIVSNVRVLAVDQTASEDANGAPVVGKTATLEVDPEQIPVIAAAEASGSVSLALRAAADARGASAVVDEKTPAGVVRFFGGSRSTLLEVPSSRLGDS
ncbi:Flp pilus assembly protein CpaB [Chelativorans salis]|uniref:Flp pilus assembly protein CpaB n=1 Tax=Chelativorans salis TaxID=2978478 RepID=A0ABT2LIY9_9HYPH|nr:Flp pilus assembly protein CpaB [Chelativorans sp. EGI FJ00035]MCT7374357.1 Flp pilus assembly protein CpaB [Chelativorans sp. EGI FJ00035]